VCESSGSNCVRARPLHIPKRRPCTRCRVVLLQDPGSALPKACQWRAATLGALCADSLGVVAEALKQRGGTQCWQFRQLTRNLTGGVGDGHCGCRLGTASGTTSGTGTQKITVDWLS
jgi:hypothetical protein